MPFVNLKVTEGITREQKEKVIEEITSVVSRVLDKNPLWVHVVIDEVPAANWGTQGRTIEQLRAAGGPEEED